MISKLQGSTPVAFGFEAVGTLTSFDVFALSEQLDRAVAAHKWPIGLLADLTRMNGADWTARWNEMRVLQRHSDSIARLAIISDDQWEGAEGDVVGRERISAGTNALFPLL